MRIFQTLLSAKCVVLLFAVFSLIASRPLASQPATEPLQPLLAVQLGHSSQVTGVAFSKDGHRILTGSHDKTAILWGSDTGIELGAFKGHSDSVMSIAISSDGHRILTGSKDKTAKLWDADTGRELQTFRGHSESVYSVAFSPDGKSLLTGSLDQTMKLWDLKSGHEIRAFSCHSPVLAVAFSSNGRRIVSGGRDDTIKIWNADTGQRILSLKGEADEIYAIAFSPDRRQALTGNHGGGATLWNLESGQQIGTLDGRSTAANPFVSVAFSSNGRKFVAGTAEGDVQLWDSQTRRKLASYHPYSTVIESVIFSPDDLGLLVAGNQSAKLLDAKTGREVTTFTGFAFGVEDAALSGDGHLITQSGDVGRRGTQSSHLWNEETGQQIRSFQDPDQSFSVAISADGRKVLTSGENEGAKVWDVETGKSFLTLKGSSDLHLVAFSADGRQILTAGSNSVVKSWDAHSGNELHMFRGHSKSVTESAAFSQAGHRLMLAAQDSTVELWDVDSGQNPQMVHGPSDFTLESAALSPNGSQFLMGGANGLGKLIDVKTGQELRTFEIGSGAISIVSVAFSSDSTKVLMGGQDGAVKLFDVATGKELRSFEGHTSMVNKVAFSPTGHFVLTASNDGTTKIWDLMTGRQLCTLISFTDGNWAVVDPDGRFDSGDLDSIPALHWIIPDDPMRALPIEIFMRDYYTPRLLARILNSEQLSPIRSIAEIKNRVQPKIEIVSIIESKLQSGRVDVTVRGSSVTDSRGIASGLSDLKLFRNGQLVGIRQGFLSDDDFVFSAVQLPAASSKVTFTGYAFNTDGIKSGTVSKEYSYTSAATVQPRAWLLQIGENHYGASSCELNGSVRDAEELSNVLSERLKARGYDVHPFVLTSTLDSNHATKNDIRNTLAVIAGQATPDDAFFLSFSGHGYGDAKGQFYMLPSDIRGSCKGVDEILLAGAISADELTQWLKPIDAGEMTFILDSCDSASSIDSNGFKPGPMGSRGLGQLAYDKRMRILAASQPNQAARESDLLHQGLLSYALTQEGLVEGKADWQPKDGRIMLGEWVKYGAAAVPRILQSGAIETQRGLVPIGGPKDEVPSIQTPAVFDFSKQDIFVLQ